MNVCCISFHCCPFSLLGGDGTGGMNVYLREISLAFKNFPDLKMDIFTRIQNPKIRGIRHISPQIRVIHLKGGPERCINRRNLYKYIDEFSKNLENFIYKNNKNFTIVYSHYWLSGLIGREIKKKLNIPLIHLYHTLAFMKKKTMKNKYEENSNRLKSEKFLAYYSDGIISSSIVEKENMIKEYGLPCWKLKVVYPGVNPNIFYPSEKLITRKELELEKEEKVILYVGRIDPIKGLFNLVEALEIIRKNEFSLYKELKLIVIGGGKKSYDFRKNNEIIRIKHFIQEKKINNKVIFLGSKKQNILKNYYSASDILVVPSLYESFGLVAIESLACGTPVIASKIGEMQRIIQEGKNGFYFAPNNPYSLASCISFFFRNKNLLWKRENISKDVIERFSWQKTAIETLDFFEKIIKVYKIEKKYFSNKVKAYHQISTR